MSGRAVLAPLECEKLVYRMNRSRVSGRDPERAATWQLADVVSDDRSLRRHQGRARHCRQVHERGRSEVGVLECASDVAQMPANRERACGIIVVAPELDPTSVRQVVEAVDGRILVHTHRNRTALLHSCEARVLRVNQL